MTKTSDFGALLHALEENNNIEDLKKILQNFVVSATNWNGSSCLHLSCRYASSPEVMKLFIDKIIESGGADLLLEQLSARDQDGWNCLIFSTFNQSCPRDAAKFLIEKIVEVGGIELLSQQLSAMDRNRRNILMFASKSSFPEVMKFFAAVLFSFDLFIQQYDEVTEYEHKNNLKQKAGIDSSSWTPDAEGFAEVETLLGRGGFIYAIYNNQHSRIKDFFKNNSSSSSSSFDSAKTLLYSKIDIISHLVCFEPTTTLETTTLLFSEIKRISGGDKYLKEILSKEKTVGETCVLSVCLHDVRKLELFLNTIEEVGGEEFLAEQISKKRQSDGMTCLYALCETAPEFECLSLLVSKIFQLEDGRRYLREQLDANQCLECILSSRKFDSADEKKFLFLMAAIYSITELFEEQYSRFDKEKRDTLRRICGIQSGKWCRIKSRTVTPSDIIALIKSSIKNGSSNKSSGEEAATVASIKAATKQQLLQGNNSSSNDYNDPAVQRAMFDQFDYNGDGVLSRGEILPMMMHFFTHASPKEIERKVKEFDTNSDGKFSFEEFSKLAMSVQKQREEKDNDFL